MSTRYRWPTELGGGEYEGFRHVDGGTETPVGTVAFIVGGGLVCISEALLTEVSPELPPEPLNGSFVRAGEHYFQRDDQRLDMDHSAWWNLSDDRWSTWEQVCQLGTPVRLVQAPEPIRDGWHEKLRARREELGWPQQRVAEAMCVQQSSISDYETGGVNPLVSSFIRWADVLGFDVALIDRSAGGPS